MLYRCVAAIPNSGGGCIEHFYEDTAEGRRSAEAFAREHDKPGMGVYDCVSPLRERRRTKDNVAHIEGLHADIDAYKMGKTKEEIVKGLHDELMDVGILSRIHSSGRGIHVHFLFREPIEAGTPEAERAQRVLKRLVGYLGADPQPAHFAALMRRLGTTNSKEGGGPCKALIDTATRCELSDIEAFLDLVSEKEALFPSPESAKTNGNRGDEKAPLDIEAEFAAMRPGDEDGHGVNATQVRVITSLIWKAEHPDDIVKRVVGATMAMAQRMNLPWDRAKEEELVIECTGCQYRTVFEKEYDFSRGVIPIWLPMEFHPAWSAALANGRRPVVSRNGRGWHIRSYGIDEQASNGASAGDNPTQSERPRRGPSKMTPRGRRLSCTYSSRSTPR